MNPCRKRPLELGSSSNQIDMVMVSKVSRKEEETVVGFDDEAKKLVERLTSTRKHLEVISIVGMAGLGKTTLATKVYNDPFIEYHFHIRAWTYVSKAYQKRDLLLGILNSVIELTEEVSEMSDQKLSELLRKHLMGNKYLIVMDDLWEIGAWDDLKRCFPENKNGSKIMFTSRLANVPLQAQPDSCPYNLRFLTEHESWVLLEHKVFPNKTFPPELRHIGETIIKKCKGLPIAIVVIAGVLANEMTPDWWRQVAKSVSSYILSDQEQFMETLALSYNYLPHHLKECFLYLGVFPEDYEIPVRKLIWLWVAEGFIHHIERKSLEDVAEDYLKDLINRSLVIVDRKKSNGETKSCRIHDLLHDLCLRKAKTETSFINKRLCLGIHSAAFYHSFSLPSAQHVHSLLCFANESQQFFQEYTSSICQYLKRLRVLDLSSINILLFPSEIVQLVDLRYCALQAENGNPPVSISNLKHLETLIVFSRRNITLPENILNMAKLRHLYTKSGVMHLEYREALPSDNDASVLENLQTLSFVCPSRACQVVLARSPNLRKLGFYGPLISKQLRSLEFPDLSFSVRLETLKLLNTSTIENRESARSCNPMMFPERLKKLTLLGTALDWKEMWTLGMLPNLEVLKLKLHACVGRRWETSDGGFERLKFLKFQDLDIVEWNASHNHFPRLEWVVLHRCLELKDIPSGLGDISTLEMLEVRWCGYGYSLLNSVDKIRKEQKNKGNDWLKISIDGLKEYSEEIKAVRLGGAKWWRGALVQVQHIARAVAQNSRVASQKPQKKKNQKKD